MSGKRVYKLTEDDIDHDPSTKAFNSFILIPSPGEEYNKLLINRGP